MVSCTGFCRKSKWFLALFVVGCVTTFVMIKWGPLKKHAHVHGREYRMEGSSQFIQPLLECEVDGFGYDKRFDRLRKEIVALVDRSKKDGRISDASLYVRALKGGSWVGVNETNEFRLASLKKLPLLIAYLKKADDHPEVLEKKYLYNGTFNYNDMANIPSVSPLETGKEYSVSELLRRMMAYSDNNSAVILSKNMDETFLTSVYQDLGVEVDESVGEQRANAKEYSKFFRILYNASYLSREGSLRALRLLSEAEYKDGIIAGVPEGIEVAHKFGERIIEGLNGKVKEVQLHDCGIVYVPQDPYFVCIMTQGSDLNQLGSEIKQISEMVYKYMAP